MTPSDRWTLIQSLFEQAVTLPAAAREGWLLKACPDDPGLQREVEELAADGAAGGAEFIAGSIQEEAQALGVAGETSRTGDRVGPWRLVSEIGHGGMGTVYLAERADAEYQAQVAIKFVRGPWPRPTGAALPDGAPGARRDSSTPGSLD